MLWYHAKRFKPCVRLKLFTCFAAGSHSLGLKAGPYLLSKFFFFTCDFSDLSCVLAPKSLTSAAILSRPAVYSPYGPIFTCWYQTNCARRSTFPGKGREESYRQNLTCNSISLVVEVSPYHVLLFCFLADLNNNVTCQTTHFSVRLIFSLLASSKFTIVSHYNFVSNIRQSTAAFYDSRTNLRGTSTRFSRNLLTIYYFTACKHQWAFREPQLPL